VQDVDERRRGAAGHRVITHDRRGFRASSRPSVRYEFDSGHRSSCSAQQAPPARGGTGRRSLSAPKVPLMRSRWTVLGDLRFRHLVEYETWPADVPAAGELHRALGRAAFRNLPTQNIGPEPGQGSGIGAVNGDGEQPCHKSSGRKDLLPAIHLIRISADARALICTEVKVCAAHRLAALTADGLARAQGNARRRGGRYRSHVSRRDRYRLRRP
jgi:hypothetical protein